MNRTKQVIRNMVILAVLFFLFLKLWGLSLTPLGAFELIESGRHYGPSEVVQILDYPGGKYIMGKYDEWFSIGEARRELLFFWRVFSHSITPIDRSEAINVGGGASQDYSFIYGNINDENIAHLEIELITGEIYRVTEFYDNLFLLFYEAPDSGGRWVFEKMRGYDADNNLIFEADNLP